MSIESYTFNVTLLKVIPKKVIYNFFSYQLSDTGKLLLCKALKFSLPPKRLKFKNYLLAFELLYGDVYDSDTKDESLLHLTSKIKDVALHHIEFITKKHRFENVSQEEYDAFINLSNNKKIIIQKADKGNTKETMQKKWKKYCQIPPDFLKLHSTINIK